MKSFVFFGVLWLALGYVRPSSQTMTDYLPYNTEPHAKSCPDENSIYGATCLQLHSRIIYQCPYGFYYYNDSTCKLGKVFPGEMTLNITYVESMQNTSSKIYEELYQNLKNFFDQTFKKTVDFQSINILSVKLSFQTVNKVEDKKETTVTNNTKVTLVTAFNEKTNMTIKKLEKVLNNSIDLNYFNIVSFNFKGITGCEIVICDKNTTKCKDVEGGIPRCECKPGLNKMYSEDKACLICGHGCSSGNNKFCLMKADHVPECRCMPNFEKNDGEKCEACSIGFSGENCQDSYMAIIIGVSTLCGVLLVTLIGVTTYTLIRKPAPKAQQLISKEYSNLSNSSDIPPATNFAESGRIFPRIRATNGIPSSKATAEYPTSFYEGGAANRGYVPERDYSNDYSVEMPSRY